MFAKAETFQEILLRLSVLRYVIASNCKRGNYDITKGAENFFRDLLNIVYHTGLVNLNDEIDNHPAIDLGCAGSKLAVQVTAENTSTKIKETLEGFYEHKFDAQYQSLLILILTSKRDYRTDWGKTPPKFEIMDLDDLLGYIEKACYIQELQSIEQLTRTELSRVVAALSPTDSLLNRLEIIEGHPAVSAKKFFDFMETDEEHRAKGLAEINKLHSYLVHDSYRTMREFIFFLVTKSNVEHPYWDDSLGILVSEVMQRLRMPNQEFMNFYHELEQYRLATVSDEKPYTLYTFYKLKSLDFNFLFYLRHFLKEDKEKIKRVLIQADFTLLD